MQIVMCSRIETEAALVCEFVRSLPNGINGTNYICTCRNVCPHKAAHVCMPANMTFAKFVEFMRDKTLSHDCCDIWHFLTGNWTI